MFRGLVHVLAWSLATSAAAALSWWGVHTMLAGTVYDPPRALPVTAADATVRESEALATSASTRRPGASKSPADASGSSGSSGASGSSDGSTSSAPGTAPPPSASPRPSSSAPAASPSASGQVKSYDTDGGRAVFDLRDDYATLVSATPGAGWSMQVWKTESWIRVEFTSGADRVSVFCTWHDGPPRVEIGSY
ncbi:hypothetical protein [Streptomyces sp. NPDC006997]|uniref:hypothetical protein n=1 Tax=Streptomyces sp. NPDC006997 TaxID=3155356 RepID=UPI0033C0760E